MRHRDWWNYLLAFIRLDTFSVYDCVVLERKIENPWSNFKEKKSLCLKDKENTFSSQFIFKERKKKTDEKIKYNKLTCRLLLIHLARDCRERENCRVFLFEFVSSISNRYLKALFK